MSVKGFVLLPSLAAYKAKFKVIFYKKFLQLNSLFGLVYILDIHQVEARLNLQDSARRHPPPGSQHPQTNSRI